MQSKVIYMSKAEAQAICGGLTQTTKMPCKSNSLPIEACQTGYAMAQIEGSICSQCYAAKGFYKVYENTIKPAQFARLDAIHEAMQDPEKGDLWVSGMVALIGQDAFFRFHDSGDLQGLAHLELIVKVCKSLPGCRFWLPTREYGIVKDFIAAHGSIPDNLIVRLSAMYPDKPVKIPASLQNIKGITASNVHTANPMGFECQAPKQKGECRDCRMCWSDSVVSYLIH